MIRFIAALDNKQGLANEHGIPWQGKIPSDVKYFRDKTINSSIMMGYGWFKEQAQPLPNRRNIVAVDFEIEARPGFEITHDAREFLTNFNGDIWVGGGANLFASVIDLADELYITQLQGDYGCTKFFPEYKDKFQMVSESAPITENSITYTFQIWKKRLTIND